VSHRRRVAETKRRLSQSSRVGARTVEELASEETDEYSYRVHKVKNMHMAYLHYSIRQAKEARQDKRNEVSALNGL